ncbi:hypothetical protein RHMOL_Rhmol10G0165200 [Rhododendron molle]|uniref:Uncharacterized protein n=1 Tax=Rhododendron molle TaxID=49168 RepID=A0ACC0M431_RHOML|nr:hypothetical protein RHMOL_Rhmol10G0165200 [Rhododendron molle]
MAYQARGRRGDRGRGLVVNNGDGIDNFSNQNRYRNEIEELSTQIATLNDKVQLLMLKRQVATLITKVHRLLPRGGIDNSYSQFKSSFNYKEESNIDVDLVESYAKFNPNEIEEDVSLNWDEFEGGMELGYFYDFPIFDQYPSEDLEGVLQDDCAFEIEDEFGDFFIFDESPNEDVGGEFERVLMFDVEDVPIYDEYPSEGIDGDDILENVGSSNEEQEMSILISNEPHFLQWDDNKQAQEGHGANVALCVLPKTNGIAFEVPMGLEDFIESKFDACSPNMSLGLSLVQDVQVCDIVVPEQLLKWPRERRNNLGHLEDPLGMVFTQASLGYDFGNVVKLNFLYAKVDDSCDTLEPSVVTYVEEVLSLKRYGKWVISWHISKDAVNVHKQKLVLKMGYCMIVAWIQECSRMPTSELHNK